MVGGAKPPALGGAKPPVAGGAKPGAAGGSGLGGANAALVAAAFVLLAATAALARPVNSVGFSPPVTELALSWSLTAVAAVNSINPWALTLPDNAAKTQNAANLTRMVCLTFPSPLPNDKPRLKVRGRFKSIAFVAAKYSANAQAMRRGGGGS